MSEELQAYQWTGINRQGKRLNGVIQAADSKDAQTELKKLEIEVTSIKQKSQIHFSLRRKQKIRSKDVLLFTRYLATLISSGTPILQALDIISHDQENLTMKSFLTSLRSNIASGKTLGESFSEHPEYFGDLYINLIRAGEKSGTLDKILYRLGAYLERTEALKRKVKKALTYPIAILVVATIVSLILLLYVVPQFKQIFNSFGANLPAFTQMVITLSEIVRSYWMIIILGVGVGVWLIRYSIKRNERVRRSIDVLSLRILIIGPVLKKSIIARYARTLAITLEAGMPIIDSMKSMTDIMGNKLYSEAILKICNDLVSGNQLNVAMSNTKLFPNMAIQMIAIGEASGSLSDMLNKVADYYEEEVNQIVDNLSSLLEPLIMMILGVIIGGFVVAMYLPIFKLGSLF